MRYLKRKKLVVGVLLLLVVSVLAACSGKSDSKNVEFWSNASDILIHAQGSSVVSFNVALCTTEKINEIEFMGIEGTNVNSKDFSANIINNNMKEMDDYTYKGVYIKYIMIELARMNEVESCEFEKIILNVDGVRRELVFDSPVKYEFTEGNIFSEELQISVVPIEFHSGFLNESDASAAYEFEATEDLTITGITFTDFLETSNIMYSIDGAEAQEICFPLQVKKGEYLSMDVSFDSTVADEKNYVQTNMLFHFTTTDGENKCNKVEVVFDPVYPITDNDFSYINGMIDRVPWAVGK